MQGSKRKGRERRRKMRLEHRIPVRFQAQGMAGKGTVLNVSETGIFLQTESFLPVNATVAVTLSLRDPVTLEGKVVWAQRSIATQDGTQPGGMGIELFAVPQAYLGVVRKLRERHEAKENRSEGRFDVFHRVSFESGEAFLSEYTENLSRGGMFLSTDKPLGLGTEVRVLLDIPGAAEPLEVRGRVAYHLSGEEAEQSGRAPGVGLHFVSLSEEVRTQLHQYLKRIEIHRRRPERRQLAEGVRAGSLGDYLVPEILLSLKNEMVTGVLRLERRGIAKVVYLRGGHPVYVESNRRAETLARYLLRHGKITQRDLEESLSRLSRSEVRHGELLVQMGKIDGAELASALVGHQEEKITNTFPWFDGTFAFESGSHWPESVTVVPLQLYRVFFTGIARWYRAPLVQAWMGLHEDTVIQTVLQGVPPGIPGEVLRVIRAAHSPVSIRELSERLSVGVERLLTDVFGLIIAGWTVLDFSKQGMSESTKAEKAVTAPLPSSMGDHDLSRLRASVDREWERFRSVDDFYEFLGADPGMSGHEIAERFRERAAPFRDVNPEAVGDSELRFRVEQLVSWFKLAHDTLCDPEMRRIYDRRDLTKVSRVGHGADLEAERVFLTALRAVTEGRCGEAIAMLTNTLEENPDDRALKGCLGWALFREDPAENAEVGRDLVARALEHHPDDANLWCFQGEIFSHLENWKSAEWCFSQAAGLDPADARISLAYGEAKAKRAGTKG